MNEIYKDVPNYEKLYQVSNTGKVRALDRYNIDKNGKRKFYPGKELTAESVVKNHTTYKRVTLSKDGVTKRFQVHRLVAKVFIPTTDPTLHINHIDNNGSNNNVSNLEWVTHSQNMIHAQVQGRLHSAQSTGGKTLGKAVEDRISNRASALEGSTVGDWTVNSYIGKTTIGTKQCYAFECTCKCGKVQIIDSTRLINGSTLMCRSCGAAVNTFKSIETIKEQLLKTTTFTGNVKLNNPFHPNLRKCEFEMIINKIPTYISYYMAKKQLDNDIV